MAKGKTENDEAERVSYKMHKVVTNASLVVLSPRLGN